jgi:hypothetical protein
MTSESDSKRAIALREFREGTPTRQISALIELTRAKQIHEASKSPEFAEGLGRLLKTARDGQPEDRSLAVAAVERAIATIKSLNKSHRASLSESLASPLSPAQSLDDVDNRRYVVMAVRHSGQSWGVAWLANAAACEESSEPSREEAIRGLFSLPSVADALAALGRSVGAIQFDTERPADSMARRLRRLLLAVAKVWMESGLEPGVGCGRQLSNLVETGTKRAGLSKDTTLLRELTAAVGGCVQALMRARFSSALDSGTYEALEMARGWFAPHDWAGVAEQTPELAVVARDLREAIALLARAGVTDDRLMRALTITLGSETAARSAASRLVDTTPGLTEDVRRWLLGTRVRRTSDLAEEHSDRSLDEYIADLLLESTHMNMSDSSPDSASLTGHIAVLTQTIRMMADVRGLTVSGNAGEIVEYSALDHQSVDDLPAGIRHVRVLEPAVTTSTEPRRVVRKALVEPANI